MRNPASNLDVHKERVREELREVAFCASLSAKILAGGAVKTLIAAAGAALAFEIISSQQENTLGFTLANTVASQAIGAAILSVITVPLLWGFSFWYPRDPREVDGCSLTTFLLSAILVVGIINAVAGILENLIGAATLKLVVYNIEGGNPQSDLSAALGATAGAMPVFAILVPALVLRIGYLLAYDNCLAPYAKKEVQEQPKPAKQKDTLFAFKSSQEKPYLSEEDVDPTFHPASRATYLGIS